MWIRIAPGCYERVGGAYRLVRTEWDGPRGGTRILWELATLDAVCGWTITSEVIEPTLREAKLKADRIIA